MAAGLRLPLLVDGFFFRDDDDDDDDDDVELLFFCAFRDFELVFLDFEGKAALRLIVFVVRR